MHSGKILNNFLKDVCPLMHAKRRESLKAVLDSCLRNERVSVTSLGRGIRSDALEKHNIKRADRLLSNSHLYRELPTIYQTLAHLVLNGLERVVILIDWSGLDSREEHFLLRASVALKGRSITIYEEVHNSKTREKRKTHERFLKNLSQILPSGLRPILVTDAGFRTPWFEEIERYNWDWVGRVRSNVKVNLNQDSSWVESRSLYSKATNKARAFNNVLMGIQKQFECNFVLYKGKRKGRKLLNKRSKDKSRKIRSQRSAAAQREPWLLATSLSPAEYTTNNVVSIYRNRMQIEESFRDMKCSQYGIGLKKSRTYKKARLAVLVAISTLTNTFAWLLGNATQTQNLHRQFQANSIKDTTVLSFVFIGLKVFKKQSCKISNQAMTNAWNNIGVFARNCIFVT